MPGKRLPDVMLVLLEHFERVVAIREEARRTESLRRYEPLLTSASEGAKAAVLSGDPVTCCRAIDRLEQLPNRRGLATHLKRVA